MCWNRSFFFDSIVQVLTDDAAKYYAFVYASQSPLFASFMPLERVHRVIPNVPGISVQEVFAEHDASWRHEFIFFCGSYVFDRSLPCCEDGQVSIVQGACFCGGGSIKSNDAWRSLSSFHSKAVAQAPAQQEEDDDDSDESVDGKPNDTARFEYPEPATVCPVLVEYEGFLFPKAKKHAPRGDIELNDAATEAAFEALTAQRQDWDEEGRPTNEFFVLCVQEGHHRGAEKGAREVLVRCLARGHQVKAWCSAYGLVASGNFAVAKFGMEGARVLATEWCRRMTHFYELALTDGRALGEFEYTEDHAAPEDEGVFGAYLALQPSDSAFKERAAQILAIAPLSV